MREIRPRWYPFEEAVQRPSKGVIGAAQLCLMSVLRTQFHAAMQAGITKCLNAAVLLPHDEYRLSGAAVDRDVAWLRNVIRPTGKLPCSRPQSSQFEIMKRSTNVSAGLHNHRRRYIV